MKAVEIRQLYAYSFGIVGAQPSLLQYFVKLFNECSLLTIKSLKVVPSIIQIFCHLLSHPQIIPFLTTFSPPLQNLCHNLLPYLLNVPATFPHIHPRFSSAFL